LAGKLLAGTFKQAFDTLPIGRKQASGWRRPRAQPLNLCHGKTGAKAPVPRMALRAA